MSNFKDLTVRKSLIVYALFVVVIFIFEGFMGLNGIERISRQFEQNYNDNVIPLSKINKFTPLLLAQQMALFEHIASNNFEEMNRIKKKLEGTHDAIEILLATKNEFQLNSTEENIFDLFSIEVKKIIESHHKTIELSEDFVKEDAFNTATLESKKIFDDSMGMIAKIVEHKSAPDRLRPRI